MSRLTEADHVRKEYENEAGPAVRAAAHRWFDGPVDAAITYSGHVPDDVPEPFVVSRLAGVFVATR